MPKDKNKPEDPDTTMDQDATSESGDDYYDQYAETHSPTVDNSYLANELEEFMGPEYDKVANYQNDLAKAISEGKLFVVRLMHNLGADINKPTQYVGDKILPIMHAIVSKRLYMVEYVISIGANVVSKKHMPNGIKAYAFENSTLEILIFLMSITD